MVTRPVVFSASSVNTYLNCHLQWYFAYVLLAPSEETEPQRVGIAVHEHAERVLKGQQPAADQSISMLTMVFDRDILPTFGQPVLIETAFQIEVNGIPYSGVIDVLDRQGERFVLRDLKTTSGRPSPGRYRLAMTGYYLGITSLGQPIDAMRLDYIVRTRTPYYWPEDVPLPAEEEQATFVNTLSRVAEDVDRGDYEPTGLGTWVCSWCSYRSICGPYQRLTEVTDG